MSFLTSFSSVVAQMLGLSRTLKGTYSKLPLKARCCSVPLGTRLSSRCLTTPVAGQAEGEDRTPGAWVFGCSERKDVPDPGKEEGVWRPGNATTWAGKVLWPERQSLMRHVMQTWPTERVVRTEVMGRRSQRQPPWCYTAELSVPRGICEP